MSKDFTPRDFILTESILGENKTWKDVYPTMKFCSSEKNESPFYTKEEIEYINQFEYFSRCGIDVVTKFFNKYKNEYLNIMLEIDKEIKNYFENKTEPTYDWIKDWFDGKLDKRFYYSELNNTLMLAKIEELLKER